MHHLDRLSIKIPNRRSKLNYTDLKRKKKWYQEWWHALQTLFASKKPSLQTQVLEAATKSQSLVSSQVKQLVFKSPEQVLLRNN